MNRKIIDRKEQKLVEAWEGIQKHVLKQSGPISKHRREHLACVRKTRVFCTCLIITQFQYGISSGR